MSEPKIPFRDVWPADISIRDDAQLGRAWRRCEAALPKGWMLECVRYGALYPEMNPRTGHPVLLRHRFRAIAQPGFYALGSADPVELRADGDALADALNALTDALESRNDRPVDDAASPTIESTSRPDAPG